jgi:hypothetical protein
MISMLYLSTATEPFPASEVTALVQKAQETNARLGITGLLLFKSQQFMQLLEGDDDQVADLYARITADPRHRDVKLLLNTPTMTRHFPEWAMAYRPINGDPPRETIGYADFLDPARGTETTWRSPSRAQWLLDWFRLRTV